MENGGGGTHLVASWLAMGESMAKTRGVGKRGTDLIEEPLLATRRKEDDSNQRPPAPKAGLCTAELRTQIVSAFSAPSAVKSFWTPNIAGVLVHPRLRPAS
jgi:hypothetical protein